MLGLMLTLPVKEKADRVYCYCSLKGKNVLFVAFYTAGDKAVLFADELNKVEMMELNMAVMSQLVYLKSQYEDCPQLMPSELFLDFDPVSRKANVRAGMESFTDPNELSIRSLIWFKEHGGKLKRSAELAMKMRFKAQAEAARDPAANAVEIDLDSLDLSRKYVAGEVEDPSLSKPETGWDAVRAAVKGLYTEDSQPMSFESDDGNSWVDVYDCRNNWLYISCGLSAMGAEPEDGSLGGEYILSLKKKSKQDEDDLQIFSVLNLVRAAIAETQSGKVLLADYSHVAAEEGGLIVVPETRLGTVNAPGGSISFKKLVYITASELQALESGSIDVQGLYKKIGSDISDCGRKSVI
ncbi:MAG: suppressor of fused domain protein [Clostridia bacterium]|nr:suppressor of fused domain protein [Clostridia bacterium]